MAEHPITPSPELVEQWKAGVPTGVFDGYRFFQRETDLCIKAARWGADQELEACCAIAVCDPVCGTKHQRSMLVKHIRERRRPKPLTLKEQALERCNDYIDPDGIIRRALEALPDV